MAPCKKYLEVDGGYTFQIKLIDMLQRHGSDIGMNGEIIKLIQTSLQTGSLHQNNLDLLLRNKFISCIEKDFKKKS